MISIARIVKTRGVRGEVAAALLTDFPDRFKELETVWMRDAGGHLFQERLEGCWFHQGRAILKFEGRDDPDAAAPLVGCELQIPDEERLPLPPERFYHSDLVGCRVVEEEDEIGTVSDVFTAGEDVANLVVREGGREWMLPLVREYVVAIDLASHLIRAKGVRELRGLAVEQGPGKRKRRRLKRGRRADDPRMEGGGSG